jgi:hypothetical protein
VTVLFALCAAVSIFGLAGMAASHDLPALYLACAWPAIALWLYVRERPSA